MDSNADRRISERLASLLREIEFPGEERSSLLRHLEDVDFTARVINRITLIEQKHKPRRTVYWIVFLLFNLALILLSGTGNAVLRKLFSFEQIFSLIFSIVLGIIILAITVGLILTVDTSWLRRFLIGERTEKTEQGDPE